MLVCVSLVAVLLGCLYVCAWCYSRRARTCFAKLPQFPALPFLGNIHLFRDGKCLIRNVARLSQISDDTGLPFVLWVGPCPILFVIDPEDLKTVTNNFIEKPYYYKFGKLWLGDGLVTAPGLIWKKNIKKLAGTFTGSIVEGYQPVFNAQAQKLVDKLKTEVGAPPFDAMQKYLALTTLETICYTALGMSGTSENIVTNEYYQSFIRALELLVKRGLNLFMHSDFLYSFTNSCKEFKKCIDSIHNVSDTVIKKRRIERAEMRQQKGEDAVEPENVRNNFKAFIDIILDLSESDPSLTEHQIQSEVNTIIVGGQETVATTLYFTLLVIGTRTDVQDKLYAEINEIFGGSRREVQKEDLLRMRYCEGVINETLRLYPALPVVLRYADRDLQLKSCTVPRGTAVGVNAWGAGRSERAWGAQVLQYNPDRWLHHPSTTSLIAFSTGKRACIGKRYAMSILKTILAYCVRDLVFITNIEGMQLKMDIALKPFSGHLMEVKLR